MASIHLPDCVEHTFLREHCFVYKWIIDNFNCGKVGFIEVSTSFSCNLNGFDNSVNMNLQGSTCENRFIDFKVNVGSDLTLEIKLLQEKRIFNVPQGSSRLRIPLYRGYKCLLIGLNVTIDIELSHWKVEKQDVIKNQNIIEKQFNLNNFLDELYKNRKFWDVTFNVAGHEIHAHKCILASRSKVFAAMFEQQMEEKESNKVTITDIEREVFEEMLQYIYTDEVLNLNTMAYELLTASDKYDLKNLKLMCEYELENSVTTENAAEILIIADLHRADNLKQQTVRFILNNNEEVKKTEGWKKIVNNYNYLIIELYLNITK